MADQIQIKAQPRAEMGTRAARRFRDRGLVPGVMLHKREKPVHLLIGAKDLDRVFRKGARIVDLEHPGGRDRVFIKEVQYDHLGESVYHVDFVKVAMDELIQLEVEFILKGKPVGVTEEGGVLDQYVKKLKIECLPSAIPDHLEADVAHLKKDEHLQLKDVKVPAGVKLLQDPELVVAAVTEHKIEEVVPAAAAVPGPAEPEVIKKEKEGAEGEEAAAPKAEKKEAAPKKEERK